MQNVSAPFASVSRRAAEAVNIPAAKASFLYLSLHPQPVPPLPALPLPATHHIPV